MKPQYIKWLVVAASVLCFADSVLAQTTTPRRRRRNPATTQQPANAVNNYGAVDTTQKPANSAPATNNYGTNNYGNSNAAAQQKPAGDSVPIKFVAGSNGLLDTTRQSLRNDAAIELNLIKDRTPLEYENIREDDAVYRVRVWREIDIREKINLPFRYAGVEDNGGQRFISILLGAIKSGQVTAFSNIDDRFTTPLSPDGAFAAFGAGNDTVPVYDANQNLIGRQVSPKILSPDSIYKFRLKEEWIFDKETSRMYVRILGIAPVIRRKNSTGEYYAGATDDPAFWVYYPDLRPVLAKYDVYNPKNFGARMTWEDLFESRMFSSYIIKSTLDNPYDQTIAQKYPNNTLFRLLEGEKIKDKIFDYEQSLWSY